MELNNKNDLTPKSQNTEFSVMAKLGVCLNKRRKTLIKVASVIVTAALWLTIWYVAAKRVGLDFILPSPQATLKKLLEIAVKDDFLKIVLGSMLRVIGGFALGVVCGTAAAFLAHFLLPLKVFFAPMVKVVRATPVASFILIAVLWMNAETVPIFIAFLMVFPIVYGNVVTGLAETDPLLRECADMYGFSPVKKLLLLYVPSASPYLGSACLTSMGLAWKSGIAAEVLCVTLKSVGYYIYTSKIYFETEALFAWTVTVIVLSVALEAVMKLVAKIIRKNLGRRYA
jgi:NitT/TauT family transport system permease protein